MVGYVLVLSGCRLEYWKRWMGSLVLCWKERVNELEKVLYTHTSSSENGLFSKLSQKKGIFPEVLALLASSGF